MFGSPETWSMIEKWGNLAFAFYFTLAIYDWFVDQAKKFVAWRKKRREAR